MPNSNSTGTAGGPHGFDRLSVVEKVFTILGVVVAVVVPFIIFLLTRRHLQGKKKGTHTSHGEPREPSQDGQRQLQETGQRGRWRLQLPITRS